MLVSRRLSPVPSGVVPAAVHGGLRHVLVTRLLDDRRNLGVRDEALPALGVPVEDHPDAVVLVRVAEDGRALRAVLLALLGALRREDLEEAVHVLDRCGCEQHLFLLRRWNVLPKRWLDLAFLLPAWWRLSVYRLPSPPHREDSPF